MPIRFRCRYCNQLMGISRMQAGKVVQCTSCGRELRVPPADGRGQAVPPPKLNLKDSTLADALNELARIGQVDPAGESSEDSAELTESSPPLQPTGQAAPVSVEVVTLDPLPTPEPIELELLQPRSIPEPPPGTDAASNAPAAVTSWPVDLFPTTSGTGTLPEQSTGPSHWTKSQLAGAAAALLAMYLLGILTGWWIAPAGPDSVVQAPNQAGDAADNARGQINQAAAPAAGHGPAASSDAGQSPASTIRGRITWKSESGESRPDSGARVILLPPDHEGESRISAAGLRSGDSAGDVEVARAALRAMGGDVAVANEQGQYAFTLPEAGTWQILVISRFQPRPASRELQPGMLSQLQKFFTRPADLIGQLAWHTGQVRYNGSDPVIWDHSFERQN